MKKQYIQLINDSSGSIRDGVLIKDLGSYYESTTGELIIVMKSRTKILKNHEWAVLKESIPAKKKASNKKVPDFMRPMYLSPELKAIVKIDKGPRTEVVKRLWKFIKDNNLQDLSNRRNILVGRNQLTKDLFKRDSINMFEMTKHLNLHYRNKPFIQKANPFAETD